MKKIVFLLMLLPRILQAQSSQGPIDPSVAENTSCPFSYSSPTDYLPAENALASDDVYASASHCDCCDMNTRCFETKGYGFDIPLTAIIDGIMVEVEKKASSGSMVQDNGVMLLKAGITTGNSYATANNWPSADAYYSYGGSSDLWGTNWLPADINDFGFGIAFASISYTCIGNNIPAISYIDHIRMTVYYTDIATTASYVESKTGSQMVIIPNLLKEGSVYISLPMDEKRIKLSVADITGKIIEERVIVPIDGKIEYVPDLPRGQYVISAKGSSSLYTQKLMIQ